MFKKLFRFSAAFFLLVSGSASQAALLEIALPNLFANGNSSCSATTTGNGYVAPRQSGCFGSWFHVEELAGLTWSRVMGQGDISSLAGMQIDSATLDFFLQFDQQNPNGGTTLDMRVTSWNSIGTLSYAFPNAPSDLGFLDFAHNQGANSFDITQLVSSRVSSGADWFGFYLSPETLNTNGILAVTPTSGSPDAAQVRLRIEYSNAVPEPGTIMLLSLGAFGLAVSRRKQKA